MWQNCRKMQWEERFQRERARYDDGMRRLRPEQLVRLGNAAYGAGLCLLMLERDEAREWLARAAIRWRESWDYAAPDAWGRPVGVLKAALLARGTDASEEYARWVLFETGAAEAESPIGRYAATLACLAVDRDGQAFLLAEELRARDDFPRAVANALFAISSRDKEAFAAALESVLVSFETRTDYLEDVPVADTVLALNELAGNWNVRVDLRASPVLPPVS